jgi:hypothetical protein
MIVLKSDIFDFNPGWVAGEAGREGFGRAVDSEIVASALPLPLGSRSDPPRKGEG